MYLYISLCEIGRLYTGLLVYIYRLRALNGDIMLVIDRSSSAASAVDMSQGFDLTLVSVTVVLGGGI